LGIRDHPGQGPDKPLLPGFAEFLSALVDATIYRVVDDFVQAAASDDGTENLNAFTFCCTYRSIVYLPGFEYL
jgi:hypothetical protein